MGEKTKRPGALQHAKAYEWIKKTSERCDLSGMYASNIGQMATIDLGFPVSAYLAKEFCDDLGVKIKEKEKFGDGGCDHDDGKEKDYTLKAQCVPPFVEGVEGFDPLRYLEGRWKQMFDATMCQFKKEVVDMFDFLVKSDNEQLEWFSELKNTVIRLEGKVDHLYDALGEPKGGK